MKRIPFVTGLALGLALPVLTAGALWAQEIPSVELVIATGVADREPVGVSDTFPSDVGQLFAWMRVSDASDQAIEVVWTHGPHVDRVPLEIGGSPWRTWSSKDIPPEWTGEWTVEVRDAEGTVLASTSFTVQPPAISDGI